MKSVLITGCAGFIGSYVSTRLCSQYDCVVGIDNLNDYYDVRLKEWRLNRLQENKKFKFVKVDIENRDALNELFSCNKFDAVINLAARAGVGYSITNPHVYVTTNVLGTLNLLECCKAFGIKKFVLASTSSLYAGKEMPFKEDLATTTPISPYAATKGGAEGLCYSYHYLYDIDVTIFRYFTVYGPAGRPDMSIFRFIKWALEGKPLVINGDGTQSRDFTYVTDIAEGTVKALNLKGYQIINLGGDEPHLLNEVVSHLEQYFDKKLSIIRKPFPKEDIRSTWADIDAAKKLMNWQPKVALKEGLNRTLDWSMENKGFISEIKMND